MRTLFDAQDALLEILTAVADNRIDLNRAGTHPLRSSANLSVTAEGRARPKKTNVQAPLSQMLAYKAPEFTSLRGPCILLKPRNWHRGQSTTPLWGN